jgi:hypothetical protein
MLYQKLGWVELKKCRCRRSKSVNSSSLTIFRIKLDENSILFRFNLSSEAGHLLNYQNSSNSTLDTPISTFKPPASALLRKSWNSTHPNENARARVFLVSRPYPSKLFCQNHQKFICCTFLDGKSIFRSTPFSICR